MHQSSTPEENKKILIYIKDIWLVVIYIINANKHKKLN